MLRHVVLLHLDDRATDEVLTDLVGRLRELPDRIEQIEDYEVGIDLGLAPDNATIVVIGTFADEPAYGVYRDHPAHRELISEHIAPLLASRSAVQYRTEAPLP